jgi:hypothetical protein
LAINYRYSHISLPLIITRYQRQHQSRGKQQHPTDLG